MRFVDYTDNHKFYRKNKNDLPPATKLSETAMNRTSKLVEDDFLSGFICYNYGYLLPVLNEF